MRLSDDGKTLLQVYPEDIKADGSIEIPEEVIFIGERAFARCFALCSVILPKGVSSIGYQAFLDCSNLHSITLPDGLKAIGDWAFSGCDNLQFLTLPEKLVTIGAWAFSRCIKLQSIVLPAGVQCVGDWAFYNCQNLHSIILSERMTFIGEGIFSGCNSLYFIALPESVASIANGAFYNCINLQFIIMSKKVMSIGDWAFENCRSLRAINLPEELRFIGDAVFSGCNNLYSITLSEEVHSLGMGVFTLCDKLQSIMISGCDGQKRQKVINLLPANLQGKVLSIELSKEITWLLRHQISRVIYAPQINALYPYLLPDEILGEINCFGVDETKIAAYLNSVPMPKNQTDFKMYRERIIKTADDLIKKPAEQKNRANVFMHYLNELSKEAMALSLQGEDVDVEGAKEFCNTIKNSYQQTLFSDPLQFKNECNIAINKKRKSLTGFSFFERSRIPIPILEQFIKEFCDTQQCLQTHL